MIDQSGPILRIGPNPQHQSGPTDDFLTTKTEGVEAGVVDLQAKPGFKFRNTDRMGTEAEGFGEELISCWFDRIPLAIAGLMYRCTRTRPDPTLFLRRFWCHSQKLILVHLRTSRKVQFLSTDGS